ncbi:hypothetical protein [Streptomyces sp. BPTC-684]|uniref:hypothetical protein n=1 Tax=Streptomyces sp. BPTC-684 TaxID=3043734 RepID=UPI0024B1AC52|nr:hypothetical protein [Streptomyces sp. BPTC-684]WHM39827.1 hypothetical protein QIY60_25285 [Streptomyces sp. BPTC-684]
MHRTRTAARLLVGVAALAVSGCVTVPRGPAPGPPAPPPRQTSEQADRNVRPQIVQAPVREALEAALPPVPAPRAPAARPSPAPRPHPHAHPAPPRPAPHPAVPHLPHVPSPAPLIGDDVCDLGRSLGGWRPDSPEARICEGTYGK